MYNFKKYQYLIAAVLLPALLISAACQTSPPGLIPPALQAEAVLAKSVASLAATNRAMATVIVQLNAAKTLTDPQTKIILGYNRQIADACTSAVGILQSTSPQKVTAVLAIVQSLAVIPPPINKVLAEISGEPNGAPAVSVVTAVWQAAAAVVAAAGGKA